MGASATETTEERLGNADGAYEMRILFSNGCSSYQKSAMAVQEEVEKMHPQQFQYILYKESSATGNMEITVCKKGQSSANLVHSKKNGQGFPNKEWEGFHTRLETGMQSCN